MASSLLKRIEAYLRRARMRPTEFGRRAVGDGLFVSQLRRGRIPRPSTQAKVDAFLDRAEKDLGDRRCRRR